MGEVWAATGPDGREVAVKLLPEGSLADPAARARFAREVAAANRVRPPAGPGGARRADAEAERPWLATELVDGPTLAQRVAADGPVHGPEPARAGHRAWPTPWPPSTPPACSTGTSARPTSSWAPTARCWSTSASPASPRRRR